ncbi:hypothetical protein GNX14_30335 [Mesorhizobium japonicum]|nr:hypothetical protein [Mesorhizobium japonicum]MUT28989.1 hypothetical protein [Mesorhizobium japonicum]QGX78917.1 hypothetical protein EB234_20040 [Mesorhizobium japonicum R7A]
MLVAGIGSRRHASAKRSDKQKLNRFPHPRPFACIRTPRQESAHAAGASGVGMAIRLDFFDIATRSAVSGAG